MAFRPFVQMTLHALCGASLALACAVAFAQARGQVVGTSQSQLELFSAPGAAQSVRNGSAEWLSVAHPR